MKFFVDTANLDEVKKANEWGILDGVTTNPSLIAKEGVAYKDRVLEICKEVGPGKAVSAEVTDYDFDKSERWPVHGRKGHGPRVAQRRLHVRGGVPDHPGGADLDRDCAGGHLRHQPAAGRREVQAKRFWSVSALRTALPPPSLLK